MTIYKRVRIFSVLSVVLFCALIFFTGQRQGWFASKSHYQLVFDNADGIFPGAAVTLMGLKVGSVEKVDIDEEKKVIVSIKLQTQYAKHFRRDSRVMAARPFVLAEKEIVIYPGTETYPQWEEKDKIHAEESLELTDFLTGNRLMPYLTTLNKLFEQIQTLIEGKGANTPNIVKMYSQISRSLSAIEELQKDMHIMRTEVLASEDTKKVLRELAQTLPTLKKLSDQATGVMPELSQTLKTSVITLEAMQRSFFLRSGVESYKKENQQREPASK